MRSVRGATSPARSASRSSSPRCRVVSELAVLEGEEVARVGSQDLTPGHWLKLTLHATGNDSGRAAEIEMWLAHHPGDMNQDGDVNVRDATAFGEMFRGGGSTRLLDLNGDGQVDARDATTFGDIWRGTGDQPRPWRGSRLTDRPPPTFSIAK